MLRDVSLDVFPVFVSVDITITVEVSVSENEGGPLRWALEENDELISGDAVVEIGVNGIKERIELRVENYLVLVYSLLLNLGSRDSSVSISVSHIVNLINFAESFTGNESSKTREEGCIDKFVDFVNINFNNLWNLIRGQISEADPA
jgi:hypothetical protein